METVALPADEPAEMDAMAAATAPQPRHKRARLRVGLLAAGAWQPRWMLDAFGDRTFAAQADIEVIAMEDGVPPALPRAWRTYLRLDFWCARLACRGLSNLSASTDLRRLGPRLLRLGAGASCAGSDWKTSLMAADLDALFLLGDAHALAAGLGTTVATLAGLARYGCWSFRFGTGAEEGEAWAGLVEVVAGNPLSTSQLVAYLPDGGERLLVQSWTRTAPFSIGRNRHRLLCRSAQYPGRALRDLREGGDEWFANRATPDAAPGRPAKESLAKARPATPSVPTTPALEPALERALPAFSRVSRRVLQRGLQKLAYVDQWFLAYRFSRGSGDGNGDDWGPFTCLLPPRDRFWADPFPLRWGERHLIFFEELPFARNKAHISVIEVSPDGSRSEPTPVLRCDYHLSYPFLFEAEGQLFMVPETGRNRSVELYRCLRIPDVWRLEKVLLRDAYYVDATLHQAGGRWWMFVNVGHDLSNLHDELHLYHADHFLGPWLPHRANPVKSDVRSARCGGRLYQQGDHWIRPAQICVPRYGSGLSLNQVMELSPERYREQEVGRILPPHGARVIGVHTLNRAGAMTVVDGFLPRRRWGHDLLLTFEPVRTGIAPGSDGS